MNRHLVNFIVLLLVLTTLFTPAQTIRADNPVEYAGDASQLVGAMTTAEGNGGATTIVLTADINLTTVYGSNGSLGADGLPVIHSDIMIEGQGFTILRPEESPEFRIFNVAAGGSLTVYNVTISGGLATSGSVCDSCGGGVYNAGDVTLSSSKIMCSSATRGGGVYNASNATISNSTFTCNSAFSSGGGLYNNSVMTISDSIVINNAAFNGGGLFNASSLTISGSTFDNDSAVGTAGNGGGMYDDSGGVVTINGSTFSAGFANDGAGIYTKGLMNVINSTFAANQANDSGGAVYNSGDFSIWNSTLSGNSALIDGGGLFNAPFQSALLSDTIIANSPSGGDCSSSGISPSSLLVDDDSCGISPDSNIKLGALADNGGNTKTFGLLNGSSALDSANNSICAGSFVNKLDQRGVKRGVDADGILNAPMPGDCDIGSLEVGGEIRTLGFATAGNHLVPTLLAFPVTLTLDAPLDTGYAPITAYVWVSGGTASAGIDYAPFGVQTVTFNPGDKTATVTIYLLNGPISNDKTIILSIAAQNGPGFSGPAKLGAQLTHTVTLNVSAPNAAPSLNYDTTFTPTLTWNRIPDALGYEVQVDSDNKFAAPYVYQNAVVPANQLYVQIPGLGMGVYYWRVQAKLAGGKVSGWSAVQSFMVLGS